MITNKSAYRYFILSSMLMPMANAHGWGLNVNAGGGGFFGTIAAPLEPEGTGTKALSLSGFGGGADVIVGVPLGGPKFRLLAGLGGRYMSLKYTLTLKTDATPPVVTESKYTFTALAAVPMLGVQFSAGKLDIGLLGGFDYGVVKSVALNRTEAVGSQSSAGAMDSFGGLKVFGRIGYRVSPQFSIGLEPGYHLSNSLSYKQTNNAEQTVVVKNSYSGLYVGLTLSYVKAFGEGGLSTAPNAGDARSPSNKRKPAPRQNTRPPGMKQPGVKKTK